jgi:hypothetical protein
MHTDHSTAWYRSRPNTRLLADHSGIKTNNWYRRLPAAAAAVAERPLLLSLIAALVSIAVQGFDFGIINNVFHIPIVLRLYDLPQFANDAYMQSLRKFVSPIYQLFGLVANDQTIGAVFFAAHVTTRFLTFYALLRIVMICGVGPGPGPRLALAAATFTFCRCINGLSQVGADGMLINYFTHSELAQALALHSLAFLLRGRMVPAAVFAGSAFDLNAFIGFWTVFAIAACGLPRLIRSLSGARENGFRREAACAAGIFLALVGPELLWVHRVVSSASEQVDYRAFLQFYYGKHFFLSASTWGDIARNGTLALSGLLALQSLRASAWFWLTWAALVSLFAAGVLTDPFSTSRLWLGLHLLRVDGLITMLTAPLAIAAACRRMQQSKPPETLFALSVVLALIAGSWPGCALSLLALAGCSYVKTARLDDLLRPVFAKAQAAPQHCLAAVAVILCVQALATGYFARLYQRLNQVIPEKRDLAGAWPNSPEWLDIGKWARASTAPGATFLIPPDLDGFRISARRVTSLTWKEGGAVMWGPELYRPWLQAMRDIRALRTARERLDYACSHNFTFVVEDLRRGPLLVPAGRSTVYANRWFAAIAAKPCLPGAA